MTGVPQGLINFVLRVGIGRLWYGLLMVAEQVQNGQRPLHTEAIQQKPEIYQFIQQRAQVMLERLQKEHDEKRQQQQQTAPKQE
jgi:hypothetical protein